MNNHIKVFLSSTFEDMQNEREYLVKKIFPAIKTECERRDVEFSVVDLRWGISEEQSSPGKIIDVCLKEIDSSRPFFIGLVGERYGTMWSREDFSDDETVLRDRPCVEGYMKDGMSITEMEMQYGVFDKTDDVHAFFYIKKAKWYRRKGETHGTKEEKLLKQKKLGKLIDKIDDFAEQGKVKAERYSSSSQLGTIVYQQMMEMLEKQYPVINDDNEMARLARTQKAWMRELCKIYYGDENVKTVESLLDGSYTLPYGIGYSGDILCKHVSISGKQGAGKSALLANLCNGKNDFFYIRACNEVSDGTQLLELLKHMAEGAGLDFANDTIFCAIDDSEKLTVDAKNFEFWLMDRLPDNIRVIYSCSGYYKYRIYDRKTRTYILNYEVKDLNASEVSLFIEGILKKHAKKLITRKKDHIGNNPLFHTPGMLRLLLNEMVQYGSYERIDSFTDKYLMCKDRTEFFACMLQRMEEDYGRETIQKLLGLLALIPIGLPSDDLRDCIDVSHMEWAVLNEVLDEFLTLRSGMLVLDSNDMRNAVQARYMSDASFVNDLRRDAIILLHKERKRREPKLWNKNEIFMSVIDFLLCIVFPSVKYSDVRDPRFKQVNDALVDQYIALDMKKELRHEYLSGFQYVECCSPDGFIKVVSYAFNDIDLICHFFSYRHFLLFYISDKMGIIGRMVDNQSKETQDKITKKIRSMWLLPASIKNNILENVQTPDYTSINYFSPDCNHVDLNNYVKYYLFRFDDESIPVIYDKVKNLLESGEIKDETKLCLYNLIAAYCFYRLEQKWGDNPYYERALELDEKGVIVSQTLFPFIIGEKEEYEPLLERLRKNVTIFEENTAQRINAEIHLAKAEFIDAIASSYYYYPNIRVSYFADEILNTDEDWRLPVERLFSEQDVAIAGYNKYYLACQFAKLAYKRDSCGDAAAWAYSFAYRFAETRDQRIFCLKKILKFKDMEHVAPAYEDYKAQLVLQVLDRVLELLQDDDAHPLDIFTTMQSKVEILSKLSDSFDEAIDEAIEAADKAYSYFNINRESFDDKAWGEYSYAKALYFIWYLKKDKFGSKHLLDKAYTHYEKYEKQLNYFQVKERNWYIARLNMNSVIVNMCQNYGVTPEGVTLDSALSGYKEFLSELRSISEKDYNSCLKNYCFLLLRAGRIEEAITIVNENAESYFFSDDLLYISRRQEDIERCESMLRDALYENILNGLVCHGNSFEESDVVLADHDTIYAVYYFLIDYKERIGGNLYFTFQMLVEYAKNNKTITEPESDNGLQRPKNKWNWQVARHIILLLNAMCLEDASEQDKAYNDAMQYLVSLYKECKNKKTFSLIPIFPMLMLMSKIKLKEQHQNRSIDTIIWFKDIYKSLVEETGEESDYIEWDLTFPFVSLQRFLDDDSSEYGGLKTLVCIMLRVDNNNNLDRIFRHEIINEWNSVMEYDFDKEVYKKYAYRFINLYKETSFLNNGFLDILINILIYEESKDELIDIVDYFVNNGECNAMATYFLSNITFAMLEWGEGEKLLTWLDTMWKDYKTNLEKKKNIENSDKSPIVYISYAKVKTLCHMERYEEAYQHAITNHKEFEYVSAPVDVSDKCYKAWYFYFCAGKAAMLTGHLHDAMDFFTKDLEVINEIQYAVNNSVKTMGNVYTQDEVDSYKIDNGCMIAICMLKQGNIEDGKRHFAEHVEPLLSDADADNDNVKLYQETLSKLA